jgi:hypothetical protein
MNSILAFRMMNLVGTHQRLVDAPDEIRHAVGGVKALIGIHLPRIVGIGGRLPSAHIDRLQSGVYLLNRLIARHGSQRRNVRLGVQQVPKPFGALLSQRVFNVDRALQPLNLVETVRSGYTHPAWV